MEREEQQIITVRPEPETERRVGCLPGSSILLALGSLFFLSRRAGEDVPSPPVPGESVRRGHETVHTASVRGIVLAGIGLLLLIAFFMVVLYWLLIALRGPAEQQPVVAETPEIRPREPRLQVDPALDLKELHAAENVYLYTYGWLDPAAGVVHIPIEQAMLLIAERGLPTRDAAALGFPEVMRVPTESGYQIVERGVPPPAPPPVLGASPEPYTTWPVLSRILGEEAYLIYPFPEAKPLPQPEEGEEHDE